MVYEGPMSDSSTAIYGLAELDERATTIFRDSRYGDFDDYLAFTAEAPAGTWFTGKVPRFVLDPTNALGVNDWLEPVEVTSKYAEIVYWVSPEWVRDGTGALVYGAEEVPLFVDNDGTQELDGDGDGNDNGIPDTMVLRRRVLLIRPDLVPDLGIATKTQGLLPKPDPAYYQNIRYPFATGTTTTTDHRWWISSPYMAPNWDNDLQQAFNSNWLTGMTLAYQLCDLSLGRRVDSRSTATTYGDALDPGGTESAIQLNSLNDLMRSEYRFGHVRIPGYYFGLVNGSSVQTALSMPLLALTGSTGFFSSSISGRSHNAYPTTLFTAVSGTNNAPLFNGFILPQFELSNLGQVALLDPRWNRTGEDVIATNVLGFDVQLFDPEASVLLVNGVDGAPGNSGIDDDNSGTADDVFEQGTTGSDDVLVTPDDPAYFSALINGTMTPATNPYATPISPNGSFSSLVTPNPNARATVADRGAFVDLGYAINAGSPLRDLWTELLASGSSTGFHTIAYNYLRTPMSGYHPSVVYTTYPQLTIPRSQLLSGRTMYRFAAAPAVPPRLFQQMVYDTSTNSYESDGFNQSLRGNTATDYATWWVYGNGTIDIADRASNGLDDAGTSAGVDDASEYETSPPVVTPLKAIRIRIRLEEPETRQLKQIAIVHDFE